MKRRLFAAMMCCLSFILVEAKDCLVVSPIPQGIDVKQDFAVRVRQAGGEWQNVGTYAFRVDRVANSKHNAEVASVAKWEMEGTVEVEVTSLQADIANYRIRPLSYNIQATQEGRTLRFTLDRPRYISVEINGDIYHNLQIFADNIMQKPKVKKKNLMYFGPGVHDFKGDSIHIPSGKTVFIDNGAVINGWFSTYKSNNVRILGHGIIMPRRNAGIQVRYSKNVEINGPLTTQMPIGGSDSVCVSNAKVISWYGWGDGFNVFASNHVHYNNIFARTSDDCSTIYCTRKDYHGGCQDITVKGAVYWADVAHPIMIGLHSETNEDEQISNVLYEDIDILEQAENQIDYQGCIGINNGDNILVKDIIFQNIRIENLRKGMLVNLRVCWNKKYCTAPGKGIEDILFRNISYNGNNPNMGIITGYNEQRKVRNIRFENLRINGTLISDDMPSKPTWYKTADMANIFVGEHVENLTFTK